MKIEFNLDSLKVSEAVTIIKLISDLHHFRFYLNDKKYVILNEFEENLFGNNETEDDFEGCIVFTTTDKEYRVAPREDEILHGKIERSSE
jgi:hypothetical protein